MCLKNGALPISAKGGASGAVSSPVKKIHVKLFKQDMDKYTIIDIQPKSEFEKENIPNSTNYTLTSLLVKAETGKLNDLKDKEIVLVCATGDLLARIASTEMNNMGFNTKVLDGGISAYLNEKRSNYEMVVMYGKDPKNVDAITMALSFAFQAQNSGVPTALVLLSDGVHIAKPKALEGMFNGQPFKKCDQLFNNFMKKGGAVFCCGGCLQKRKVDVKDLVPGCMKCNSGDVVRWSLNNKGTIQYL